MDLTVVHFGPHYENSLVMGKIKRWLYLGVTLSKNFEDLARFLTLSDLCFVFVGSDRLPAADGLGVLGGGRKRSGRGASGS